MNRQLFAYRRLEWWLSSYTLLWGLGLVVIPTSLDSEPYVVMRWWAPAIVWGVLAAGCGMFHIWALVINGRRCWSPFVRLAATTCNAAVFTITLGAILAAVWHGLAPASGTVIIHIAPVWAGVCAFWVAGADSWLAAERIRGRRGRAGS